MRIAGLARREVCEFGGHRLAEDDRAGTAQPCGRGRVLDRPAAGVQHGAVFGGQVGGVDIVLERDRHAVQRAEHPSRATGLVAGPRLFQHVVSVERLPGLYLGVARIDGLQAGIDKLLGEQFPGGNGSGGFGSRQCGDFVLVHRRLLVGAKSVAGGSMTNIV